jgi:DNA-binding protein YbaB
MDASSIKEFQIKDDEFKSIEQDVYDINTKVGIKIKMKSNRLLEKIYIPYELLKDKDLESKIVSAVNEASELVSVQVSEDIFKLLLKKGIVPKIIGGNDDYE